MMFVSRIRVLYAFLRLCMLGLVCVLEVMLSDGDWLEFWVYVHCVHKKRSQRIFSI